MDQKTLQNLLNDFKDVLFDFMNESDELNVADIITEDRNNLFRVLLPGGAAIKIEFSIQEPKFDP